MENNKEYIFYLNWEDNSRNDWSVGFLAKLESEYYLSINSENGEKSAYKNGFIGIPGFRPGEIYKSSELFDFFKNRILNKESLDPCAELKETGGKSQIDSFSLVIIPEKEIEDYKIKERILKQYEEQEKIKKEERKKIEEEIK